MTRRRGRLPTAAEREIDALVPVLRETEPTPFAIEGAAVAHLRSGWCLLGWRWQVADEVARAVVDRALRRVGANRPTWNEAHDCEMPSGACLVCESPLYGIETFFCSERCNVRHQSAKRTIARSAARAAARVGLHCQHCGAALRAKRNDMRFCGAGCYNAAYRAMISAQRAAARVGKTCRNCGEPFTTKRSFAVFCGSRCAGNWHYKLRKSGAVPRKVRAASGEAQA